MTLFHTEMTDSLVYGTDFCEKNIIYIKNMTNSAHKFQESEHIPALVVFRKCPLTHRHAAEVRRYTLETVFGRRGHGESGYRNTRGQGWLSCHYRAWRQCVCVCECVTSTTLQWHHSTSYRRTIEKEWRDVVRGNGQAVSVCALPTPSRWL